MTRMTGIALNRIAVEIRLNEIRRQNGRDTDEAVSPEITVISDYL